MHFESCCYLSTMVLSFLVSLSQHKPTQFLAIFSTVSQESREMVCPEVKNKSLHSLLTYSDRLMYNSESPLFLLWVFVVCLGYDNHTDKQKNRAFLFSVDYLQSPELSTVLSPLCCLRSVAKLHEMQKLKHLVPVINVWYHWALDQK